MILRYDIGIQNPCPCVLLDLAFIISEIELKYCIFLELRYPLLATKFENSGSKNKHFSLFNLSEKYMTNKIQIHGFYKKDKVLSFKIQF